MTQTKQLTTAVIHKFSLAKLLLAGALVGLITISFFVLPVLSHPHPNWSKYWMIRPLIVTPIAGIMGGVWYYLMDFLRYKGGWKTIVASLLTIVGCIIAIWMGIVLGLVGTMWH